MKIVDRVYGKEEIKEKVFTDLINSEFVQRLKGISQFGVPEELYHRRGFSRFEHSLGVLILLGRLEASKEEQVAGLLHDVSHSAFSHVIDRICGDPLRENYQDNVHYEFIENSNLPKILSDHLIDYRNIADLEKHPLLDRPAPELCVDRVDYLLREVSLVDSGVDVENILNNLTNYGGRVIFVNAESALTFTNHYVRCQEQHWSSEDANTRFSIFAEVLKCGLEERIISMNELRFGTDESILKKLTESGKSSIVDRLNLLRDRKLIGVSDLNKGVDFIPKKFRFVDPEVLVEGCLVRVSSFYGKHKRYLEGRGVDLNSIGGAHEKNEHKRIF